MIRENDRVYVSSVGEYGKVTAIINVGMGLTKYRVTFDGDRYRGGIYGEQYVCSVSMARTAPRLIWANGAFV